MKIDIVTVFPEYFDVLGLSLLGKAQAQGLVSVNVHNLRDWTHDVHHAVDDTPVGGGAGMVMKPQVWGECLDELLVLAVARNDDYAGNPIQKDTPSITENNAELHANAPTLIFPNPSAPLFNQQTATELSTKQHLLFACSRYEGYDARIPEFYRHSGIDVREYSIGDYVLNGGEVAATVMLEAITRLLPGFMGNPESVVQESYTGGEALLEHPQYTKPATWRELQVPQVLLSGDHGRVDRFRRDEALTRTSHLRPDMIEHLDCDSLDVQDRQVLVQLGWDLSGTHPSRHPERRLSRHPARSEA